jgi:hypothetical protein
MIYDLSHQIINEKGEPAVDETGAPASLKTVLGRAVLTDTADNAGTKLQRFELWLKLRSAALAVELTTEEASLIKQASSIYSTLVHGQVVHWIEGKI